MNSSFVRRELCSVYGSISVYNYGVAIAGGLLLFIFLMQRHPRFKKLGVSEHFVSIILGGLLAAVIGGRTLYVLTESDSLSWYSFIAYWQGGFSVLGSLIALLIFLPFYLRTFHIPVLPFLDLAAIHAPLLQSIARVGCFFAGCCYGIPTTADWGFIYTDPLSSAPQGICLHPTQLYSAILLLLSFAFLYFYAQYHFKKPGQLLCVYLMLISFERFVVDFWRADRLFLPLYHSGFLSVHQVIAGIIFVSAGICLIALTWRQTQPYEHI